MRRSRAGPGPRLEPIAPDHGTPLVFRSVAMRPQLSRHPLFRVLAPGRTDNHEALAEAFALGTLPDLPAPEAGAPLTAVALRGELCSYTVPHLQPVLAE